VAVKGAQDKFVAQVADCLTQQDERH